MKIYSILLIALVSLFSACSMGNSGGGKAKLAANEFSEKLKQTPTATLMDVRTPEEFSKGHLENAVNIDWNGDDFEKQISSLDKSKPMFVYCLSGGRSSSAASKLREVGFKEVYELEGGIMKWRGANLPETTATSTSKGMTMEQFKILMNADKSVLIDFYADWCAPCKRMLPYLEEITRDMEDKVIVLRINADDNQSLMKELKIDELPVLQLYKNKTMYWSKKGYTEKDEIVKAIQ